MFNITQENMLAHDIKKELSKDFPCSDVSFFTSSKFFNEYGAPERKARIYFEIDITETKSPQDIINAISVFWNQLRNKIELEVEK